MREVAFGQYYPADSFAHKLDPRTKILFLICYIIGVFITKNFYGLAVCTLLFALAVLLSKVPLRTLVKSVKAVLFLLVFTAVLNLFFRKDGEVIFNWAFITVTKEGVYSTIFLGARLFLLVLSSSLLTLTTTPVSLTDGIESLLSPLKKIKFPVHELALVMSIALRFIPILTDETARIMNAQKSRGADFESGSLIKKVKAVIPVLIPLLVSSFRRADELGDAMDARCYSGSAVRTKYKKLTYSKRDLLAMIAVTLFLVGVILLKIYFPAVF
ncbi:MAG: energy-coupling factor transporter transmembrane protein EcfT [Clostridiales bacterium]|nr:energy-coupling factor transporter transmembrane protein EcfT [Clostridiales bacterium]